MKVEVTDKYITVIANEGREVLDVEDVVYSEAFFNNDLTVHPGDDDLFYLYNSYNGKVYACDNPYYTYIDGTWLTVVIENLKEGKPTNFSALEAPQHEEVMEYLEQWGDD